MNTVFRVDASTLIGTGHVMRCLVLAEQLREEGYVVFFISRELEGNLNSYIELQGFRVIRLYKQIHSEQEDADETLQGLQVISNQIEWLIVDHYRISEKWESIVRNRVSKLMVIDDLANRYHHCDILLDHNFISNYQTRYDLLVPPHCKKILGLKHLLIRKEFIHERIQLKQRDGNVRRLLIFFGGSDPTDETEKALKALKKIDYDLHHVDVVVGTSNRKQDVIYMMCEQQGYQYHSQITDFARLLSKVDLVIGAGGISMWERCYLGVPSITAIVAKNQQPSVCAAHQYGAVWKIGWHEDVKVHDYAAKINDALSSPQKLINMSQRALAITNRCTNNQQHSVVKTILQMKGGEK
ncbi:UDP-2,4-diacetamido-2,4,6-trideoxy-beta-L-altropyranose hydrolase [Cytobacillus sp. IB215316]|uniref:UDP-2,4-diacetamido-2,4, 6-trideoxy-beta-L-altropyranose hydrolase n=1 Tax=Cytobacillus sp. IB215316 TaxID=3097354 RepID=UPI002A0E9825|nr:UDP-2,4-diacetamido-2,4,6-trideoxy-beta-L-altropyranose hydrolase [Cytobacillus sp. IB215316]MDX8359707.1 UDP-2,4-diacetamido-2,4,6-trideoxy-beta-L-altropyranose hydrolase [Cytobacillus sp. IB215316]